MPFKSEAQRRYLYSQKPDLAKKWRKKYGPGKNLPDKVGLLEAWQNGKKKLEKRRG